MAEEAWQELLKRNKELSNTYKRPVPLELVSQVATNRVYILSCADGRINPNEIFGIKNGEANVLRNAGAYACEDTFRSLEIMGSIAPIGLIVVLRHEDCGGLFRTDDKVKQIWASRAPEHAHTIQDKVYGCFGHIGLDESIRQQVDIIRAWKFLPPEAKVTGYAYEIETGLVREVVPPVSKL